MITSTWMPSLKTADTAAIAGILTRDTLSISIMPIIVITDIIITTMFTRSAATS